MTDYLFGKSKASKAHLAVEGNLSHCGKVFPVTVTADEVEALVCQTCDRHKRAADWAAAHPDWSPYKLVPRCHRIGCGREATSVHVRMDVPVCDYHTRAPTNSYTTKRPCDGVTTTHGGFISRSGTQTRALSRPRWEGMDVGENGPVRIVNPIKWCVGCKQPIEAKYTYCLDCFRRLSDAARTDVCRAQRIARRQRRKRVKGVRPS